MTADQIRHPGIRRALDNPPKAYNEARLQTDEAFGQGVGSGRAPLLIDRAKILALLDETYRDLAALMDYVNSDEGGRILVDSLDKIDQTFGDINER